MAILILQEQGKLNVHDKIKKYLPDAPKAWDEITIEHLLTHTSGIYDAYAGRYDADVPGKDRKLFTVSRDGSRLMCEPMGKAKLVLTPESATLF